MLAAAVLVAETQQIAADVLDIKLTIVVDKLYLPTSNVYLVLRRSNKKY